MRRYLTTLARRGVLVCEYASSVHAHLAVWAVVDGAFLAAALVRSHIQRGWLGNSCWVEGAGAGGGEATAGEDGGDNGEVILEFVEIGRCGRGGFIERVEKRGIVWAEGEFGDDMGKVEIWMGEKLLALRAIQGSQGE